MQFRQPHVYITPATINTNTVIPANTLKGTSAGIQNGTGCRIKSGMTTFDMFICRINNIHAPLKLDSMPAFESIVMDRIIILLSAGVTVFYSFARGPYV